MTTYEYNQLRKQRAQMEDAQQYINDLRADGYPVNAIEMQVRDLYGFQILDRLKAIRAL